MAKRAKSGKPRYLPHWTADDIAKWEAGQPRRERMAAGAAIRIRSAQAKVKEEWERRVKAPPFPEYSVEELYAVAHAAEIPDAMIDRLSAGDIYRLAMEVLDPKQVTTPAEAQQAQCEKIFPQGTKGIKPDTVAVAVAIHDNHTSADRGEIAREYFSGKPNCKTLTTKTLADIRARESAGRIVLPDKTVSATKRNGGSQSR